MYNHFKSKLKQGQSGEDRLHKLFPDWLRADGRVADFVTADGHLVELKTESRSTADTPNLAIEMASSPGKAGAIERAVTDNIDMIVFMYSDDKLFAYHPAALLEFANVHRKKYRTVFVPNDGYDTEVLLIPRSAVTHLERNLSELDSRND